MIPIGDVLLTSPAFKANPYPFYARLRSEAPVFRVTLPDRRAAWLVSRYDDVLVVLKDARFVKERASAQSPEQSAREPWTPKMFKPLERTMIDRDGTDHDRLRGLVHLAFTPRMVDDMRGRIQTLTDALLVAVEASGRMDLIADYALPLPATIIAEMLGVPARDQRRFHRWSNALVSTTPTTWGKLTMIPHVIAFVRYIRSLIAARRADPRDDLTSALVAATEAGDRLDEDELLGMIFLLLIAGHETTVNLIGNGVLALLQHPDQMERLRDDPAPIKPAAAHELRTLCPRGRAARRFDDPTRRDGDPHPGVGQPG
jgi:cytochrome P450 PksS